MIIVRPVRQRFEYKVLGKIDDIPRLTVANEIDGIVIAVGDNYARWKISEKIKELCPKLYFPSIVHPSAIIGRNVTIGEGSFIAAGVVISPAAKIGKFCVLNTACLCGHDSVMDDFSAIFSSSSFGAYCRLGFGAAVGMGATIIPKITIGEHTIIGGGAVVVRNIDAYKLAYGTPAIAHRDRRPEEKYM